MTPIVPLGYPFFLTFTGARGAIIAQPIIYSAALAFMGREIVRTTRNTWLAVAAVAGCLIVPQIRDYHASILSESLFLSLLVVFLGLSIRFAHHPTWRLMVLVAITVGASAVVRRTGFAFVPVMLRDGAAATPTSPRITSRVVLRRRAGPVRRDRGRRTGDRAPHPCRRAVEPDGTSLVCEGGADRSSACSYATMAQQDDPIRRALDDQLEHALAPIRSMLASAPYNVRGVLTIYYETCLQGGCADEARALTLAPDEARQTELMGAAGLARIRRAPLNFLKLTWLHYGSLWTVNRLRHPDTVPALNAVHRRAPADAVRTLRAGAGAGSDAGVRTTPDRALCAGRGLRARGGHGRAGHARTDCRRVRPAAPTGICRRLHRGPRRARRTDPDGPARRGLSRASCSASGPRWSCRCAFGAWAIINRRSEGRKN